jgi:hypothetical protein
MADRDNRHSRRQFSFGEQRGIERDIFSLDARVPIEAIFPGTTAFGPRRFASAFPAPVQIAGVPRARVGTLRVYPSGRVDGGVRRC